jgi:hypothetical protein
MPADDDDKGCMFDIVASLARRAVNERRFARWDESDRAASSKGLWNAPRFGAHYRCPRAERVTDRGGEREESFDN